MEDSYLEQSIDQLEENIDDLEKALEPVTGNALIHSTGKLPVLDKAKLYVLTTYAIESILFSYIRLNAINAKEHPIFRELTRVRQYFEKIKAAENGETKRENLRLNKPAAARIIKHALIGNEHYDRVRSQQQALAKAGIQQKLQQPDTKRKLENAGGPDVEDQPEQGTEEVGASQRAGKKIRRSKRTTKRRNEEHEAQDTIEG